MAFKEISAGGTRYPKYNECEVGELIVEGKYIGTVEGKYGVEHKFEDDDGTVVLGSAGHLNYLMEQVKDGDLVQVKYAGSEVLKKGAFAGKSAHRFSVAVDDGEEGPF